MFGSRSQANCDLTTSLQNYALTCQNKALQCRQRGAQEAKGFVQGKELTRNRDARVAACETEATVWEQRAKVAAEGFLLVDPVDSRWMLTNSRLIGAAAREGRVRYVQADTAGDQRLATQSGQGPYEPGTTSNPNSPA